MKRGFVGWLLGAVSLLGAFAALLPENALAFAKHEQPIPGETLALMAARDTDPAAPILMRTFKKE
ncbi:MAG: hypothetical protein JO048_16760, partial [Methylobacteriaceae bacterium]|nr:hypothetical protein [Methylobacteriaceae bacterium]